MKTLIFLLFSASAFGQVTWITATKNTDGTSISDLIGYRACVGKTLPPSQCVDLGNVLTYTFSNLTAGTYYATVATRATSGVSDASNPVQFVVTATAPPPQPPVVTTEALGTWTLRKGTSNVLTGLAAYEACKAEAEKRATATATKYFCNVSNSVTVKSQ